MKYIKSHYRKLVKLLKQKKIISEKHFKGLYTSIYKLTYYKKDDETDCSNNQGMLLLSFIQILLVRLSAHIDEIIGYHQNGSSIKDELLISYALDR